MFDLVAQPIANSTKATRLTIIINQQQLAMSSSLSKGQNELSLQQENNALKNKIEELRVENRRQVGKNETLQKLQTDMKLMPDAMGSVGYIEFLMKEVEY